MIVLVFTVLFTVLLVTLLAGSEAGDGEAARQSEAGKGEVVQLDATANDSTQQMVFDDMSRKLAASAPLSVPLAAATVEGAELKKAADVTTAPHGGVLGVVDAPDGTSAAKAAGIMALSAVQSQKQPPPLSAECTAELPCNESVQWKGTFKGINSFHIPMEGAEPKRVDEEDRIWQADLNPAFYERNRAMGAEINPYEHMDARQMYMQFLAENMRTHRDKYMRTVDNLDDVKDWNTQTCGQDW